MSAAEDKPGKFDERALPSTLDLLVPWELPDACELSNAQRAEFAGALTKLQRLLESSEPDPDGIGRVIAALPASNPRLHKPTDTRSPLSSREVEEYNRYFLINHVDSDTPALAMLHSLLLSCQVFHVLCASDVALDAEQVAMQRRGYLAHVELLRRVFGLHGAA